MHTADGLNEEKLNSEIDLLEADRNVELILLAAAHAVQRLVARCAAKSYGGPRIGIITVPEPQHAPTR